MVLEFHHVDKKTKSGEISGMIDNIKCSLDELKAEINKCIILCSNCHKIETAKSHNSWLIDPDIKNALINKDKVLLPAKIKLSVTKK